MVTVTGASNAKAVIPLIQAGPNYGKLMYILICLHPRRKTVRNGRARGEEREVNKE